MPSLYTTQLCQKHLQEKEEELQRHIGKHLQYVEYTKITTK